MKTLLRTAWLAPLILATAGAHDDEEDYSITETHRSLRAAMKQAIDEEDTAFFDALLKKGYLINKTIDADNGYTALHEAVSRNKLVMIRHLLKCGADPLARDRWDSKPVEILEHEKGPEFFPILEALKRVPTDYDKQALMKVPAPVWREILGPPGLPQDPLVPPDPDMREPLVSFVSINGEDPPADMKRVLDAHYPGWRGISMLEYAKGGPSQYRDKKTKEFGQKVEITFQATTSDVIPPTARDRFAGHARGSALPAYEFKVRTVTGDALSGGGTGGFVVLINGYWIKTGVRGWDE